MNVYNLYACMQLHSLPGISPVELVWKMYKVKYEVLLSDHAARAAAYYELNLSELAVCAIRDEIKRRAEIDTVTEELNPTTQNNNLRLALAESRREIQRLRAMGYGTPEALKLMVRS
jgi:hypothetical protein